MRFITRFVCLPMLLVLFFAPATYAINIAVSVGDGGTTATTNNAYNKDTTFVDQTIKANPLDVSLSNHIFGGGSLPGATRSIKDSKGNYAETYRSIQDRQALLGLMK